MTLDELYISVGAKINNEFYDKISEMEELSLKTCEMCGKMGNQVTTKGWIKTLCEECRWV